MATTTEKVLKGLLLLLFSASIFQQSAAADRYWISASASNWNNTANWSTTAGGAGGASVPAANDRAFFTSNANGNCTLDMNVSVSHLEMQAGYTGTFNQSAFTLTVNLVTNNLGYGMILSGGTFTGGASAITCYINFTINGATVSSTSGTLTVYGNFSLQSGTFNHSSGLVIMGTFLSSGSGSAGITNNAGTLSFYDLEFNTTIGVLGAPGLQNYFSVNNDFDVIHKFSKTGVNQSDLLGNDIHVKGDVALDYSGWTGNTPWGNADIVMDGTADQTMSGRVSYSFGFLDNVIINKPSGNLYLVNTIAIGGNWAYLQGNIIPGSSTVYFCGTQSIVGVISGTHALGNVTFDDLQVSSASKRVIQSTDTLTVNGTLRIVGHNFDDLHDGYIHAKGDIIVTNATAPNISFCGGTATIIINGTNDQNFMGQAPPASGWLPNIVIDKPSGTLYMFDTIRVERSWTYIRGNVDAVTNGSTVEFLKNPSPSIIDGQGPSATMLFDNINLLIPRTLQGDVRVNNLLNLNANNLTLNGNDLSIENSATTSIQRTTGMIISETSTGSPDISSIHWFINNAASGTTYTFPFATTEIIPTFIPFALTVQTAGTPSGTGSVSVATYPTNYSASPNNRPLPPGVTNTNSFIGNENANRELDRFWVYGCDNYSTAPAVSMSFRYLENEWSLPTNAINETLLRPHQWNSGTSVWDQPPASGAINTATNTATVSNITACSAFTLVDPTFPDLEFSASDTLLCAGEQVTYSDVYTTPPLSRQWYFPGGTPSSSTTATPVVTYNTPGVYNATLWATYPGGTLKDTLFNYIVVNNALNVTSIKNDIVCFGQNNGSIDLTPLGGTGIYEYLWNDGDTTQDRTGLSGGTYSVTVSDTVTGGCSKVLSFTISEPAALSVTLSNVTNALCSASCNGSAKANPTGGAGSYSYSWDNAEVTQTAVSLCPGNHIVTVMDGNSCTVTASVTISGSPPLTASISSSTPVSCPGQCDGAATVTPSGGSGSYSYSWGCSASTTASVTALCAGACTVTVTDGNSCTATATETIGTPASILLTLRGHDITCNGLGNGSAKVIGSGGTGSITYSWSGGTVEAPGDSVSSLTPQTISVTATDGNSCTASASASVTEPAVLALTISKTDVSCNAGNDGSAWVNTLTGGTGTKAYSWSSGTNPTNDTVINLVAGAITLTVTDANNCTASANTTITEPSAISLTINKSDVNCFGGNDGSAWVSAIGGTGSITYSWSRGTDPTNDTVINLTAGGITVTATDINGCTATANTTIGQPLSAMTLVMHKTDITCFGLTNGKAGVDVTGGTGPYNYSWSNGVPTPPGDSVQLLGGGFTDVTVTDTNGCTQTGSVNIIEPSVLSVTLRKYDISCNGSNDGRVKVLVSGGTPPYLGPFWNPVVGTPVGNDSLYNLPPGQLCVAYFDANSCQDTACATIVEPLPIILLMDSIPVTCNGGNNGQASVSASGGVGTFTYSWSNGTNPTNDTVTGLQPGPVSVTVSSGGCDETGITTITEPAAMTLTMSKQDLTCNGSNDGMAWVVVTGGNTPYTYTWSAGVPVATGDTAKNLQAGLVSVSVTDASGCTAANSINVGEPSAISITESVAAVTCPEGSDGSVNISVSGGAGSYTYLWSNGDTAQNISGLAAGLHSVIVTDVSGCSATESYTLAAQSRFEISANTINAGCGSANGIIDLSVSGGTGPFTYAWSNGLPAVQDAVNVSAGTYSVTVTDQSDNCVRSLNVLVEDVGGPAVSGSITDAADCSSSDGSITLSVSNGSGFYSFSWSNSSITQNISGLAQGNYTVTVTDDTASCISVSTFTVGVVNGITLSGVVTDAACGSNDGAITLTVSTGTPSYTFVWSDGSASQNLDSIGTGIYSVTVTDSKNCVGNEIFSVSEGGPAVTASVTNVSCFGGENGAVTLTVSGTNSFNWSNGAVTQNISGLKPGVYAVTVSDSSQCSTIKDFTVTEPAAITIAIDRSDISCSGLANGWVDVFVSGGAPSYSYSWTGPNGFSHNTPNPRSMEAGIYGVTATDLNTCAASVSVELTEPAALALTLDTLSVSCGGAADGKAWVVVTGGVPAYAYSWSGGSVVASGDTVENLAAGNVCVTVTDANGCTATSCINVPEPFPLTLTINKTDITCFGADDGTAAAVAGGGTPGYSYSWSRGTGTTNPTVTALAPGFVAVTVTDSNSCSIIDSVNIIEPAVLTTSMTGTNVNCFGGDNGTAQVTVNGGRTPYTYSWSGGIAGATPDSRIQLAAGPIEVTVTDSSGCVKTDSIIITEPATPVSTAISKTDVSCFNGNDGTATVTASGGTPGYSYSWLTGVPGNTASVTQLVAGDAIVIVTDTNNCQVSDTAVIVQPAVISLVASKTDISCFGANDGVARVVASGGTPGTLLPYTYSWSSGNAPLNLDSVTGLGAGNVTVEVRDSLNCMQSATVNIVEPAEIVLSISKTDISCFGLTDGTASVAATGGNGGFTYSWSSGNPLTGFPNVTDLPAGLVSVTVTDSRSCFDTISATITEPPVLSLSISKTDVSCFGGNNGTATVTANGGTPGSGYIYSWSSGVPGNTNAVTQLPAGNAGVTVTDSRGCNDTISTYITQPATAVSTSIVKTDISCFGGNDGTATVTASGGTPGYTYTWSGGSAGATPDIRIQLAAGQVKVTVTDTNGCAKTDSITLIQPADLVLAIAVDSNASCHGGADGGLTVSLTGGTSAYSYSWSNGQQLTNTAQTSHSIAGLTVGSYSVTVTDTNACSKQISQNIVERAGPQIVANGVALDRPTCERNDGGICLTVTTADMPLSYSWNPALNGNCPTGLAQGTYSVTITDGATCDTSLTIDLIDIPGPAVDFVKIKDSYCDDNDGQATAIVTGGALPYDFTWVSDSTNSIISTDSVITGLHPGLYSLIVADANVCDTQINFSIINIASPNAAVTPASPQTIFEGQTVDLVATSDIPTSTFSWSPATGLTCDDCSNPSSTPRTTVSYELIVIDTATQCRDTAYMTIVVKNEKNIFVPNVITPNGDGVNDVWRITELEEIFRDNELVIINRWGDEIFREKNYQNRFDGTYKGEKLPDGTYYYLIKLNDIDKTISGPITIISEE